MGKASSQKKKRRQGTGATRADLEGQRALEQLARAAQKLNSTFEARKEHLAAVSRSWWRGPEPEAAEVPSWAEGSAGDRFFEGSRMKKYAVAPRLATAEIPSAEAFAADSGHWDIAISALIRAVVLDRVPVTDPLVTKVIRLLGPAVDAEVRYAASGGRGSQPIGGVEGGFPEDDAPVLLLGACCLVDATWAVVGLDPLRDVLDYLGPRLDAALAELNCTLKPSGKVLAETLLRAAADFYRLDEEPADAETMRQLGGKSEGNPLDCLISEKAIEPGRADHWTRRARDARGPVPYCGGVGPGALLTPPARPIRRSRGSHRHPYHSGSRSTCAYDDCQDAARGRVPDSARRPVTRFDRVGMSNVKVVSSVPPLWCVVMAWIWKVARRIDPQRGRRAVLGPVWSRDHVAGKRIGRYRVGLVACSRP
jgi:hypothetical protein